MFPCAKCFDAPQKTADANSSVGKYNVEVSGNGLEYKTLSFVKDKAFWDSIIPPIQFLAFANKVAT